MNSAEIKSPKPAPGSPPPLRPAFLLALGLVSGLWGGITLDREAVTGCEASQAAPNLRLVAEVWNQIQRHYVDRSAFNATNLTYGAIGGLVNALGDTGYSTFLTPAMVRQLKEARRGRLEGIGAEIQMKAAHLVVVAPLDGSLALRARLRPGDIILKVDGRDITGLPVDQVVARVTGPPGTRVSVAILEPHSGRTRHLSIERVSIQLHSVSWRQLPGTKVAQDRKSVV